MQKLHFALGFRLLHFPTLFVCGDKGGKAALPCLVGGVHGVSFKSQIKIQNQQMPRKLICVDRERKKSPAPQARAGGVFGVVEKCFAPSSLVRTMCKCV